MDWEKERQGRYNVLREEGGGDKVRFILAILLMAFCCSAQDMKMTVTTDTNGLVHTKIHEDTNRVILVKLKKDANLSNLEQLKNELKLKDNTKLKHVKQWKHFEVPPGQSKSDAIKKLKESGLFEHIQEPKVYTPQETIPNDPLFPQMWGLTNIMSPAAWDLIKDAPNIIVAVVDTGIDFSHPALQANIWTGPNGEHGYTCINNTVVAGGVDDHGHGTHVAGTIGAVGNDGIGTVGVAWRTKIMAIKVLHSGFGNSVDIVNGVEKIADLKLSGIPILVSNHSYGGNGEDSYMEDGFKVLEDNDIFAAAAAGNRNENIDVYPHVPSVFPYNNIVSVMASDKLGNRASFSNFGLVNTDIAAPGTEVISTTRNNTYSSFSGTSMASPHVCGLALLLRQRNPALTARQTREVLLNPGSYDSDITFSMNNTSGKINANKAIRNPKLFQNPFVYNRPPALSVMGTNVLISNNQPASVSFTVSDADNDVTRQHATVLSTFDYLGFIDSVLQLANIKVSVTSQAINVSGPPAAYQYSGDMLLSVSDNHGGGSKSTTSFEFVKNNSLRQPIRVKTWTANYNGSNAFTWIFDVDDPEKTNYIYVISWSLGFGGLTLYPTYPSPDQRTMGITTPNLSARVFVMDNKMNYLSTEPFIFPSSSITAPKCILLITNTEANVPFTTSVDMRQSTGPIHISYVFDWTGGMFSVGNFHRFDFISSAIILKQAQVINTNTGESDMIMFPIFASRFADFGTNVPPPIPTNPPPAELIAPQDLDVTQFGGRIVVEWSDTSTGEDRWEMQRQSKGTAGIGPWGNWVPLATLPAESTSYNLAATIGRYRFRVRACKLTACSGFSNVDEIRIRREPSGP